jgi:hypothetical protein
MAATSLIAQLDRFLKRLHRTQKLMLTKGVRIHFALEWQACPGLSAMKKASLLAKPHLLNVGTAQGGNI